jgi:type VI secretion system secreted protein VgrG
MVGAEAALVFLQDGFEARRVHGMIAEAHDVLDQRAGRHGYRVRLVPRAHRLALVETHDTFLNQGLKDIVAQKLDLVGLSGPDVAFRFLGTYAPRELVVQFQETDLAFVSRLTEHVGIAFYFDQEGDQDRIVFTDYPGGFRVAEGGSTLHITQSSLAGGVSHFEVRSGVVPASYVVRDYNYRTPHVDLTGNHTLASGYAGGVIEFGGHFKTPTEGKSLATVRAQERQNSQLSYLGKSTAFALGAGFKTTLEGHPTLGTVDLLVVEIEHRANRSAQGKPGDAGDAGNADSGALVYQNTFRAAPGASPYRPPRITPKPRVPGLVTGIVDAGPGGTSEVAKIDDQGRYMVRFLFDPNAASGQQVSRPVRMIQNHAGENYGTHFPLKPGIEVLIAFMGGDPDRPIIVGAAPNPLTPSPVDGRSPTTHRIKTRTGIRFDLVDD